MLLTEIVDTKRARKVDHFPTERGQPHGQEGATARAFHDEKSGTIIKHVHIEDRHDPYVRFIRLIQNHDGNPFLPKIYNAKLYKRRDDDEMMFWVQMEKLYPAWKSNIKDSIVHIMENQFGFDVLEYLQDKQKRGKKRITPTVEPEVGFSWKDLSRFFTMLQQPEVRKELRKRTTNPKFAQALSILDQVFKTTRGSPDMHVGNLMVRLTGSGPQLVIIDPIAPDWV